MNLAKWHFLTLVLQGRLCIQLGFVIFMTWQALSPYKTSFKYAMHMLSAQLQHHRALQVKNTILRHVRFKVQIQNIQLCHMALKGCIEVACIEPQQFKLVKTYPKIRRLIACKLHSSQWLEETLDSQPYALDNRMNQPPLTIPCKTNFLYYKQRSFVIDFRTPKHNHSCFLSFHSHASRFASITAESQSSFLT